MNLSVFFFFCLIALPLIAHVRQWSPTALFAVAALTYLACGAIGFMNAKSIILSNAQDSEPLVRDTYYVVNRGHVLLNLAIVMAVLAVLTWLQTYFGAMLYPSITKALFWVLHIGLIGASLFATLIVFVWPQPRRYIDYPEYMEMLANVSSWTTRICAVAVIGLIALLLVSAIQTRITR